MVVWYGMVWYDGIKQRGRHLRLVLNKDYSKFFYQNNVKILFKSWNGYSYYVYRSAVRTS